MNTMMVLCDFFTWNNHLYLSIGNVFLYVGDIGFLSGYLNVLEAPPPEPTQPLVDENLNKITEKLKEVSETLE